MYLSTYPPEVRKLKSLTSAPPPRPDGRPYRPFVNMGSHLHRLGS